MKEASIVICYALRVGDGWWQKAQPSTASRWVRTFNPGCLYVRKVSAKKAVVKATEKNRGAVRLTVFSVVEVEEK